MLLNIIYIKTETVATELFFHYKLVDDNYDKSFIVNCLPTDGLEIRQIKICEKVLDIIYQEYKQTKYCIFLAIKKIYNNKGLPACEDRIYRKTNFYKKHKNIMDKILKPISITPISQYDYTNNNWNVYIDTPTQYSMQYITLTINTDTGRVR